MKILVSLLALLPIVALSGTANALSTATWSLPSDWEAQVQYALDENVSPRRLVISGPDFGHPTEPVGAPDLPFLPVSIRVPEGAVMSNCTVTVEWEELKVEGDELKGEVEVEGGKLKGEVEVEGGGLKGECEVEGLKVEGEVGVGGGVEGEGEGGGRWRPSIVNEPYVVGTTPILSPEDPRYFGAERYPAQPESIGGVMSGAGEASIVAWVTPYRWNGRTGRLEKATSLTLTFEYSAPSTPPRLTTSAYSGLLLIVSPSQFAGMWGKYLEYRRGTHPQIEFEVVNTADIYANSAYAGKDDAQRIHKYLEYRYKNRDGRTMYVILGGACKKDSESYNSATMIPLPMTATRNRLYYPSDLYYACMENPAGRGEVWDPNNDGILLGYKSGGGYVSDARNQVDVMPDIAVFRVPVRPTASLDGKSRSAQQQIDGLVSKLRRAEAADFAGNHNAGLAGLKIFAEKTHGNTENWMTQERTFYDGMVNIWSASHASPVDDFEYNLRNQHVNWWFNNRPLKNFYGSTSSNPNAVSHNDLEFYVNEAHGAPSGAGPLSNSQMWKTTAIQKIALWDMPCSTGRIDDDRLTLPEAMILNPDGGALVSYNNAREGYGSANNFDTLSALMERENRRAYLANNLNNRTSGEAYIEAHRTFLNSVGGIQLSTTAMSCYIETLAFGDPLVKLSQVQDGNVGSNPSGLFLRTGTTTATDINVGSLSSVDVLQTPNLGGGTLTIRGQSFKAYKGATVANGDLLWSAPGGVGGGGVKFTGRRGNLTVSATGTTYFGPNFSNVNNLLVTGYNCTLDFDKTGATRDVTQVGFIGTGNSAGASGTNYLRCREGGIFSATMTIPVVNGTLALQTQNIGGGGAASNPKVPIFALTNATLRVDTNPNWGAEFFNRAIWMNNATVAANYQSVGFGANVDARPGLDIYVFGELGSVIAGPQDFEIVGELRVHCEGKARLTATASLNKSSRSGSITKLGTGTLTLSAKNTVSGGVTVRQGKLVAETATSLGTGEVTVEDGAVLELKTLPLNSITRLTVKSGGKLILPGNADTASYRIVDPLVSSLRFESGAIVCNVNAPDAPLSGSTTTDGCYLDTSLFLNWKGGDGKWSVATTDTNWMTKNVASKAYAQGDSVQFPDYGKVTNTVTVSGALTPGQINFTNPDTAYRFTGSGASISLGTLYTGGDVSFEPSLAVDGAMAVTAGRTEVKNVGATSISVGPDAVFKVNGEVSSYVYIKQIVLNITKFNVNTFTWPAYLGGATVVDCKGWRVGEIQFYRGNEIVTLPIGTTITVYAPNGVSGKKLTYKTWTSTITSSADGRITGVSGDADPKNMFDLNTGSYMGIVLNSSANGEHNYAPTCKVTITPAAPIKMFTSFKLGSADTRARNPDSWELSVTENSTGTSKTVLTRSGQSTGGNSTLWNYNLDSTPTASGSTAVSVAAGGALENGGTYKAKVNFADGAKIKVGGTGPISVAGGVTFGGNTTIDVSGAQKISGWREILAGANLAATDVYKFPLSSDDAVAKVENGKLYVATENIVKGPYSRQVGGTCAWNTTDWKDGERDFPASWSGVITRPTSSLHLDVTSPTTMTLDAPVSVGSIFVTNTTDNAASLKLVKSGGNSIMATLLDFSGFNGPVTWEPSINGASVNVGTNRVTLSEGSGATLTVASNGFATVVGPFTGYAVDRFARVHFSRTGRGLYMSQIPASGTVSFDGMELQDGGGAFQKADLTYRIENGQSLTLKEMGSMNARTLSSFEVYGGNLTVKPNGAWWFGQNGVTSYVQTNGTVKVEATGTTVGNSGSGVVFGYTGEASFVFELNIGGGRFEVPNSILNIWNPTTISLSSNAVLKAKGAGARANVAGTIEMGEGTVFEVGSAGLAGGSMRYNLYGGTLAAFENTTAAAAIELGGEGTLAAAAGTTLNFTGAINAENSTLNIGKDGYTGTVKLSALPEGVTNYNVTAGTWELGQLRPADRMLSGLTGRIVVRLTDDELRQAASGGIAMFRTELAASALEGRIQVVTPSGTELSGLCRVENGKLMLSVGYVYPLRGEVTNGETAWGDIEWRDSIGMPFNGEWAQVTGVELTNAVKGVTLCVPNAFTTALKVVNSGELRIVSEQMYTSLTTLDDSASTGKTTVGLRANTVAAGMRTELGKSGTTLNVASGKYACLANGVTFTTQNVVAGSHVRYDSDTVRSTLGGYVAGAVYSYNKALFNTNIGSFNWVLRTEAGDAVTLSSQTYYMPIDVAGGTLNYGQGEGECFYGGNASTATNSVISVNGGTFKVNVGGTVNGGNGSRGFIIGVTTGNQNNGFVTKYPHVIVNSGTFDCSTGLLAPWEYCNVYLNGGVLKAKGICRGGRTEGNLNLNGGVLEIGSDGIRKRDDSSGTFNFRLQGGTIRAVDDVTLSLVPTTSGTSYLQAVNGKRLTIGAVPSGTGTLICGDDTNNGTVELTGGGYDNLTLGGKFTIRLTEAQQAKTLDVPLFKAAADLDPEDVTVVKNDGTAIEGVKVIKDGKLCWAPATGYVQPLKALINGANSWTELVWRDSSPAKREVDKSFWSSGVTASIDLDVRGNSVLRMDDGLSVTVATANLHGSGRVSMPGSGLTINQLTGDATIVCDGFCTVYPGLTAATWTGTLVLTNNQACTGGLGYTFAGLGNANSVVEVSGIKGWFNGCSACDESPYQGMVHDYTLKIGKGGLDLNDGNSKQGYCFRKLTGEGTLSFGKDSATAPTSRIVFLDASEYTNAMTVVGNSAIIIGTPIAAAANGTICIDGALTSSRGVRLTAPSGIFVRNGGEWTVCHENGYSAASNANGSVTVAEGGTINVAIENPNRTSFKVLSSSSYTLTINGEVKLNGEHVLRRNWSVRENYIELATDPLDYPAALDSAHLWLDATADSLVTNATGVVTEWQSIVGGRSATSYTATGVTSGPKVIADALDGKRAVDFGVVGSGRDLKFDRTTAIKAVFMMVDIAQSQGAFLLGDGETFHFHRGTDGNYYSTNPPDAIKTNGKTYRNGVLVSDPVNTKIPTGYGLIEIIPQDTSTQICADRICADRTCADNNVYRNGGKKLGELIILTKSPTEEERVAIESYLMGKWGFGYVATITDTPAEFATGAGLQPFGEYREGKSFEVRNPTVADAVFNVGQAITVGTFAVNASEPLTITAEGGSVTVTNSIDDSASTARTVLAFATGAAPISAGADTVVNAGGTGTLTIGAGKKATVMNGTWAAVSFSGTAELCYAGTTALDALPYGENVDYGAYGMVSYAMPVSGTGAVQFRGNIVRRFLPGFSIAAERFVCGNGSDVSQTFWQEGGDITVTSGGIIGGGSPTVTSPVLFAHWPSDVTYYMRGGTFTAVNGADGSVHFGRDGHVDLLIGGGEGVARMRVNGMATSQVPKNSRPCSKLTLLSNGVLELGGFGIGFTHGTTGIDLAGGTLRAYADATVTAAGGISLTGASVLSADAGKTLRINSALSGSAALTIGEAGHGGKVKLAGDITGFTGGVVLVGGTLEVAETTLKGAVTIGADAVLDLTGAAGRTEYTIAAGDVVLAAGATVADNLRINGQPLPTGEKWEISGGVLRRRIITPPFSVILASSTEWSDVPWVDAKGVELRAGELEEFPAAALAVTLQPGASLLLDANPGSRAVTIGGEGTLQITNTADFASAQWTLAPEVTLEMAVDGVYEASSAQLAQIGSVRVTAGAFRLPKGTVLSSRLEIDGGAVLDIQTDDEAAAEYEVTSGALVVFGEVRLNGTDFPNFKVVGGKVVRTEFTDFHVTIADGTESVAFSEIEWNEGELTAGSNRTVTIEAPAGCTIVIDQDITLKSFTVNCAGGCTVRVDGAIVSLADGFLGGEYSIVYWFNANDYSAIISAFPMDGSTGWTDPHAVTFNGTSVNPNGLELEFTGAVGEYSSVTIHDSSPTMDGCVTFGDNASNINYLYVSQGAVRLAASNQLTMESLTCSGSGSCRIILPARTDTAAVRVIDEYGWGVNLSGATLDLDTLTDVPIPEEAAEYQLITAPSINAEEEPSINADGAKLGKSFKGSWKLKVVDNGDGTSTLVARKEKKGFSFIIADAGSDAPSQKKALHAPTSKAALDIDRDWVAEKAGLTEDEKHDDAEIAEAINSVGANGAKLYESYVLGLEPTEATSKPVIRPVQTADAQAITFQLDNVAVNARAGANSVQYRVLTSVGDGWQPVSEAADHTDRISVPLPASGVCYYRLEVLVR